MGEYRTQIDRKSKRWASLDAERSSYFSHFQEIARYLLPRSGRFLVTDHGRGEKKHNHIYDSTGTRALRVLAAGLMAGMTSPARPWFRLATPDDDLDQHDSVRRWLDVVTRRMRDIFARSNTYRALHESYKELGAFGTHVSIVLPNFENVIHHTPLTVGEYCVASNSLGVVDTLYRQYEMQVGPLVDEFGLENCSTHAKNMYEQGKLLDAWVGVTHAIEPRRDRDQSKRDAKNMPWSSCYFETKAHDGKYLRESGFQRFRAMAPRWDVVSGNTYGDSPGMEALGDVKQLQHQQLRKGQGIDLKTQPPIVLPTSHKGREVQTQPGGVSYIDMAGTTGAKPLFDGSALDLSHLLEDIVDVRVRVKQAFYEDLFLMLAAMPSSGRQITAREVAERHEEKLLMLGPVLERLHNESLAQLIDMTFDEMIAAHMVPPPPPELHNQELKVEFVSMLAQAQRAVGLASVDRLLGTIGQGAALGKTDMLDKLDGDEMVDEYAEMLGVAPSMIVANEEVAIIRKERAAQQQAMLQAETAPAAAQTAKTLSETDTQGKNGLTDAIDMFSGYRSKGY